MSITGIPEEHSGVGYFIGIFRDVTYRKRAEDELVQLANYDTLTGLPNRTLFNERIKQAIRGKRVNNNKFALLFIDLDNFKRVNDSLGHDVGDQLLIEVAKKLSSHQRIEDTVARFGGDEFTMLIEDIVDTHYAAKIAQRIIDGLSVPIVINGHELVITPSIGIAVYPENGKTLKNILRSADRAMYVTKQHNKNGYNFFNASMSKDALKRLTLETGLRKAISERQISVYYQPKVNLESGNIEGVEVLARWKFNNQNISPEVFIPIAEETGMIIPLGELVLRLSCEKYKSWMDDGLMCGRMSVNMSAKQFLLDDLVQRVKKVLKETDFPANCLEFEITEGTVIQDTERALKHMNELRQLGIGLSIDDFGTGYSSLNYLKQFPINTLKIDKSFISGMISSDQDKTVVQLIINLAHILGLQIVAEGVETEEQAEMIKLMNAEELQGFLCSKPLPADKFEELLQESPNYISFWDNKR